MMIRHHCHINDAMGTRVVKYQICDIWSMCGFPRLMLSCEVHVYALWAALWMSQWSGSAMLGVYIWMSQLLYFIVKYE
jgi:hypothetical protein